MKPKLVERYVTTGQIRVAFRAVLNHGEHSRRASEAATCAGRQGRFWAMHHLIFERQRQLWGAPGGDLAALLGRWGQEVPGLDGRRFAACLETRETLRSLEAADAEQRRRGIVSQPVFEIGPQRLVGLQSLEVMMRAIEVELP